MTRNTLKNLRLISPVAIFFSLYAIASNHLGYSQVAIPKSLNEIVFNLPCLLVLLAYSASPLRSWTNSGHHRNVVQNIRTRLLAIAGRQFNEGISDKAIMNVFYRQIDNDPTLKARSEIIMSNGFLWTTLADLSVISLIYAAFSIFTYILGIFDSGPLFLVFSGISIMSMLLQMLVTKRHIDLGNDQLEYIADYRTNEVINDFDTARL